MGEKQALNPRKTPTTSKQIEEMRKNSGEGTHRREGANFGKEIAINSRRRRVNSTSSKYKDSKRISLGNTLLEKKNFFFVKPS